MTKEEIRLQELLIEVTLYSKHDSGDGEEQSLLDGNFTFSEDNEESDFPVPSIAKWYGLTSFVTLALPGDDAIPEHHLKTVQSSITMAVAETNCQIPVFLRVLHKKANMFLGVSDDGHIRTHYDMIYLRQLPANYKCFTGLHEIFKGKVGTLSVDPIKVAARICFSTNELKDFTELDKQPDVDELKYPFGIQTDPIKFVLLHCVWPELPTSVVMHNYTNFDATKATDWVLRCVFDENPIEDLADYLEEFTEELVNEDVLIGDTQLSEYLFPTSGFSRAKQNWSKLRADKPNESLPAIPDDVVKKFLYYLFPDADDTTPKVYENMDKKSVRKSRKKQKLLF